MVIKKERYLVEQKHIYGVYASFLILFEFNKGLSVFLGYIVLEKQRIDNGLYTQNEKKKGEAENKAMCFNLGAMFMDPMLDSSSVSSNKNDEECDIHHTKQKKSSGKLV